METPVLLIIFNRPDTTREVLEAIREAKPKKLYIAADGPRKGNVADQVSCQEARAVVGNIDWDCQVKRRFLDENLGCRIGVSSAISWFFDNEEEGIILEDDCLPHPSFFTFCETLLERYRNNHSIMHIAGVNLQFGKRYGAAAYYFSTISHTWGWATWRRAWKKYDVSLSDFPAFLKRPDRSHYFLNKTSEYYWINKIAKVFYNPTTWDCQWTYCVFKNHGICIIPQVNLVTNIGFGNKAVHAIDEDSIFANIPVGQLGEITHPATIKIAEEADMYFIQVVAPGTISRFGILFTRLAEPFRPCYNQLKKVRRAIKRWRLSK